MRYDIQGLRFIAVVSVVIFHFLPTSLRGGFTGVDIFFVISGYLMTKTFLKIAQDKKPFGSLVEFYAKRIVRLAPAALVVLFSVTFLINIVVKYDIAFKINTWTQVIASTLFYQNWQLANDGVDYFASTNKTTAVQHFWSLSVEEQFYMVWPLTLLIALLIGFIIYKIVKKDATDWKTSKIKTSVIITIIALVTIASFVWCVTRENTVFEYYSSFNRFWQLSIGGLAVFISINKKVVNHILCILGLGLMIFGVIFIDQSTMQYPSFLALIPTLGSLFVIVSGNTETENNTNIMNKITALGYRKFQPIKYIGDISYSLYLWHFPIYIIGSYAFDVKSFTESTSIRTTIFIIASFIMAILSYHLIEQPTRKLYKKLNTPINTPK
jgi:peptidoglycan/LPS O-acetylase OafA/YrhL